MTEAEEVNVLDEVRRNIYFDTLDEIWRQDQKWGKQYNNLGLWMTILGEEFGEACHDALGAVFGDEETSARKLKTLDAELIQIIAVSFRILEDIRTNNVNS